MALLTSATRAPRVFKSALKSLGFGFWLKRGIGGTVTQITSRATGVTFDTSTNRGKLSGSIQTDTTSLAAEASAEFTVTNKAVGVNDVVMVCIRSGSSANTNITDVAVSGVAEGSFKIKISNNNAAGGAAETGALIINFWVFKAVVN